MSDKNVHIDNLLKDKLVSYKEENPVGGKAAFMKKAVKMNFWHFSSASFNIFYLTGVICVVLISLFLTLHIIDLKKQKPVEEKVKIDLPEVDVKEMNTDENLFTKKNAIVENEEQVKNEIIEIENNDKGITENNMMESESVSNKNVQLQSAEKCNSENLIEMNLSSEVNAGQSVLYDTVVLDKHVIVVDTIKTEVKKTVSVKDKRKKRRR
jgi:hypothetical protein